MDWARQVTNIRCGICHRAEAEKEAAGFYGRPLLVISSV
jgi:hypothetical protein